MFVSRKGNERNDRGKEKKGMTITSKGKKGTKVSRNLEERNYIWNRFRGKGMKGTKLRLDWRKGKERNDGGKERNDFFSLTVHEKERKGTKFGYNVEERK